MTTGQAVDYVEDAYFRRMVHNQILAGCYIVAYNGMGLIGELRWHSLWGFVTMLPALVLAFCYARPIKPKPQPLCIQMIGRERRPNSGVLDDCMTSVERMERRNQSV